MEQAPPRPPEPVPNVVDTAELSPGGAAVLLFLLEHPAAATQARIAAAVGLSQPRVSQVMSELLAAALVIRGSGGYAAADAERGFEILLARRPSKRGLVTGWYGLGPPREQIAAVCAQADSVGVAVRLCGDWAADLLAPWRQPGRIVIHSDASLALDSAGFVSAPIDTANLELRVEPVRPEWRPAPAIAAAMGGMAPAWPVAPVIEIAREIAESGGTDAHQAIDILRRSWLAAREQRSRPGG
jgi:hypothetical protein